MRCEGGTGQREKGGSRNEHVRVPAFGEAPSVGRAWGPHVPCV